MTRRLVSRVHDAQTGEIIDSELIRITRRKNGFRRWIALDTGPIIEHLIARRKELGADGFGVLLEIIKNTHPGNVLTIVQTDVAKRLGMHPPNVSRAVRRLLAAGVLQECGKLGVNKIYRLHPEFAWMGSAKSHTEELKRLREADKPAKCP